MFIDKRLHVRPVRPDDECVPFTGDGPMLATLEVDGAPLLRGNRSRVVFIAGELRPRLDTVAGRLHAVVLRVGPADREPRPTWVPGQAGKLHVATCFGAGLVRVRRHEQEVSTEEGSVTFGQGEAIQLWLCASVPVAHTEVVLIVESSR